MRKIQTNIYRLEYSDIITDDMGKYILIEDYLNVSITHNNLLLFNPFTVLIEAKDVVSVNEPPAYPYGYKKIYLTTNVNENVIIENYKLIINTEKTINNNLNINDISIPLYALFYQNIELYTQEVNYRSQNINQNIIVKNTDDTTIKEIKIANHTVFEIDMPAEDENIKIYLPKNNQVLQKIFVKIEGDKLKNHPPRAIHMKLINNKNQMLFQIKDRIRSIDYSGLTEQNSSSSSSYDYSNKNYYNNEYGHKYGVIIDENDKSIIVANIWSNEFEYNSNIYIVEWYLTKEQMQNIIYYIENKLMSSISFQFRYAADKDKNDNYIWRGWSKQINNIVINNPPSSPTELQMII